MKNRKEEIFNVFVSTVIVVLFFLFIGGYSQKDLKIHPNVIQSQLDYNNHNANTQAVVSTIDHQTKTIVINNDYNKLLVFLHISRNMQISHQIKTEINIFGDKEHDIRAIVLQNLFYKCKHLDAEIPPFIG